MPRCADTFTRSFAVALIEAARTFDGDAAHLHGLTTRTERLNP